VKRDSPNRLTPGRSAAAYPTHAEAGADRRAFLKGLGVLVAATGLEACFSSSEGVPAVWDTGARDDGPPDDASRPNDVSGQADTSGRYDSAPDDGGVPDDAGPDAQPADAEPDAEPGDAGTDATPPDAEGG
jgi:hypothetical protein